MIRPIRLVATDSQSSSSVLPEPGRCPAAWAKGDDDACARAAALRRVLERGEVRTVPLGGLVRQTLTSEYSFAWVAEGCLLTAPSTNTRCRRHLLFAGSPVLPDHEACSARALRTSRLVVLTAEQLGSCSVNTLLSCLQCSWNQRIGEVAFGDVPGRMARLLLRAARGIGIPDGAGVLIPLQLRRSQLAEVLDCRQETLSRALSQLAQSEIVLTQREGFRVLDLDRLRQLGSAEPDPLPDEPSSPMLEPVLPPT